MVIIYPVVYFLKMPKMFKIIQGKNDYWYRMKNHIIKDHLNCAGDNAKTHFEVLKVRLL